MLETLQEQSAERQSKSKNSDLAAQNQVDANQKPGDRKQSVAAATKSLTQSGELPDVIVGPAQPTDNAASPPEAQGTKTTVLDAKSGAPDSNFLEIPPEPSAHMTAASAAAENGSGSNDALKTTSNASDHDLQLNYNSVPSTGSSLRAPEIEMNAPTAAAQYQPNELPFELQPLSDAKATADSTPTPAESTPSKAAQSTPKTANGEPTTAADSHPTSNAGSPPTAGADTPPTSKAGSPPTAGADSPPTTAAGSTPSKGTEGTTSSASSDLSKVNADIAGLKKDVQALSKDPKDKQDLSKVSADEKSLQKDELAYMHDSAASGGTYADYSKTMDSQHAELKDIATKLWNMGDKTDAKQTTAYFPSEHYQKYFDGSTGTGPGSPGGPGSPTLKDETSYTNMQNDQWKTNLKANEIGGKGINPNMQLSDSDGKLTATMSGGPYTDGLVSNTKAYNPNDNTVQMHYNVTVKPGSDLHALEDDMAITNKDGLTAMAASQFVINQKTGMAEFDTSGTNHQWVKAAEVQLPTDGKPLDVTMTVKMLADNKYEYTGLVVNGKSIALDPSATTFTMTKIGPKGWTPNTIHTQLQQDLGADGGSSTVTYNNIQVNQGNTGTSDSNSNANANPNANAAATHSENSFAPATPSVNSDASASTNPLYEQRVAAASAYANAFAPAAPYVSSDPASYASSDAAPYASSVPASYASSDAAPYASSDPASYASSDAPPPPDASSDGTYITPYANSYLDPASAWDFSV